MSNFGEKASEHIRRLSVLLRLQENCLIICRFSHYTAAVLAEELTGGGSNTFKTFLVLVSGWKKSLQGGFFSECMWRVGCIMCLWSAGFCLFTLLCRWVGLSACDLELLQPGHHSSPHLADLRSAGLLCVTLPAVTEELHITDRRGLKALRSSWSREEKEENDKQISLNRLETL